VEKAIALGLAVIFLLTIWCIFVSLCVLELRGRERKIARVSDDFLSTSGHKPVLLYSEGKRGAMVLQILPITFACIATLLPLSILPEQVSFDGIIDALGIFFIFFGLSIWLKVAVTLWVRTLFIATDEGIFSVRLNRKRHKVVRSIRWSDITKLDMGHGSSATDLFYNGHSLVIDSAKSRIKIADNMENLEAFFQIIRSKVPFSIMSKEASLFISKPEMHSNRVEPIKMGVTRLGYSKMAKAITIILAAVFIPLLFYTFFWWPDETVLWTQVVAVAFMLLPILMLAEVFLSYYVLSDEGIERHRFHLSKVFIPWNEVESVRYARNKYGGAFRVYGANKKIELTSDLDGMAQFAQMVVAKLPPEVWSRAKMYIMNQRQ
jgi:hypothetical protein